MIKKFESYHGIALVRLIHEINRPVSLQLFQTSNNSSYVLNHKIGLYIKFSTKRLSPWRFSFRREHQLEILQMSKIFEEVLLVLVCGSDGMVAINYSEVQLLLDANHAPMEWIAVSRKKKSEYTVSGSDGKLKYKINSTHYLKKVEEIMKNMNDDIINVVTDNFQK